MHRCLCGIPSSSAQELPIQLFLCDKFGKPVAAHWPAVQRQGAAGGQIQPAAVLWATPANLHVSGEIESPREDRQPNHPPL